MPVDERDWFREEPSREWNEIARGSAEPSAQTFGAAHARSRRGGSRGRFRVWLFRLLIAVIVAVAAFGTWLQRSEIGAARAAESQRPASHVVVNPHAQIAFPQVPADSKLVHLRPRPGLDVPVTAVTRWWITDARFGHVTVYVPIGKTPREALTVALAERGYQVLG